MGLEIRKMRTLEGANVFALFPVIYGEVKLNEFLNISSSDVEGFTEKLVSLFAGLKKHKCSYGIEGGFVRRLRDGTYFPHISEHLAIEMQNILGIDVKFGKSIWIKDDIYWVAIEYKCEETAKLALRYAFEIVEGLFEGREIDRESIEVYLNDLAKTYRYERLGPSTRAILEAARARKIPITTIDRRWSMFQLGYGKKTKRISATITSETSLLAGDIAKDKYMCKKILVNAGISVPEGFLANNVSEAIYFAREIGYPVVVKPLDSHHGSGVIGGIENDEEVREAYKIAKNYSEKIIVEEFLRGDDYRFLVVNGKVIAASKRVPPYIVGDGNKNIKELVDDLNKDPLRGWGHENYLTRVRIGEEEIKYLKQQGFNLMDILPKGEVVYLRKNANLSTGGTAEDVTDDVCPEIIEEVERAAKIIGLDVCGVDTVIKDIKKPLGRKNGGIIEINSAPGLRMHLMPSKGKKRDVAGDIVNYLFPDDNGRIPVIAITGTNGKTSVTKLVGKIMEKNGNTVGLTTTGGIYVGGKKIVAGDTTGPWSAKVVLSNKDVDVAVLECARGGIWRRGLGYDRAYIGCVLNIKEDHLGVDGIEDLEDIYWIKSVVTEAVLPNGFSVVNAEDRYARKLLSRANGRHALFSKVRNELVEEELTRGGFAVYIEDDNIWYHHSNGKEKIMRVSEIKYALGGKLKVNLENALASILIAKLMNVDNKVIRDVLISTPPSAFGGRLNIYVVKNKTVVVDYAHNPDAILNLKDVIDYINPKESWCVIAIPGDRNEYLLEEDGKSAASVFDHVIITARDEDLRGREKKDLLQTIAKGARSIKGKYVKTVWDYKEAIMLAINTSKVGDAIFILMGLENIKEIEKLFDEKM